MYENVVQKEICAVEPIYYEVLTLSYTGKLFSAVQLRLI